ncbi:MAG: T9SS type A sorting domain-containing protein, partial [Bacteroidetes bacterium]
NGVKDSTEPGLEHWLIKLYDSSRDLAMVDTTDSSGFYSFQDLAAGTYTIREVQQDGWIQTHPRTADLSTGVPPGVHIVTVANGINRTELNFGNTVACRYIGPPSGSWRDPANWSCGHAPDAGTPIIIPQDTIVVVDSLSSDSIHSVRVQRGGRILFGTLTTHLRIHGSVQIDSGASIIFPSGDSLGLIVYGDWINDGSFDPGTSTIYFSGDSAKTIVAGVLFDETESGGLTTKRRRNVNDYSANNFYNLVIDGENTSLIGNMRIQNTLTLDQSLAARPEDTVFIENSSPSSIESAGLFPQGSLKRAIDQTNGGTYRFESPSSTLSFSAGDQLPDSVMVTTLPDTTTNVFSLQWRVVGGTLDTTANTIRVDSIGKFSKWVFGKPGAGYHKGASSSMQYGTPTINRLYTISTTGGGDFNATLQLRYDDDELQPSETQEELVLLQGPVVAQTLKQNWNMVSIPVVPETTYDVSALFPGAISNAFSFVPNAGYNIENSMELDAGYWLKYGSDQTIGILGDERTTATINLETDWNLIGSITFPVPTTSIVDNGAGITGSFFGYNNGYYLADTLTPMQGYWVKATASGSIMLESNGVPAAKSYSVNNVLQTLHRLLITDVAGSQQELYFGSNSELNEAMFEMPPTPPSGIFDARFANGSMVALASENEVKEMPVNLSSVTYPLQISWESPTEKNVQAEFLAGGRTILLAGKGSARIETATNLRLRIYPSSSNATLPLEYKLEQNYPNPFNPVTNFKFSVKNEGFVTLNIYDVLGREIAMVVNEKLQPGTYNTSWNAGGVASGVYFYRLTIFDAASTTTSPVYQEQKKLILVK